jgi:hypothetical protein
MRTTIAILTHGDQVAFCSVADSIQSKDEWGGSVEVLALACESATVKRLDESGNFARDETIRIIPYSGNLYDLICGAVVIAQGDNLVIVDDTDGLCDFHVEQTLRLMYHPKQEQMIYEGNRPIAEAEVSHEAFIEKQIEIADILKRISRDMNLTNEVRIKAAKYENVIVRCLSLFALGCGKRMTDKALLAMRESKLNTAFLEPIRGIAFVEMFQIANVRSKVGSQRLREISDYSGDTIGWDIICKKEKEEYSDTAFRQVFQLRQIADCYTVGMSGRGRVSRRSYIYIALSKALEIADRTNALHGTEVKYIYSCSWDMYAHVAAYIYKGMNPSVIWFAEFGDPLVIHPDGTPFKSCEDTYSAVYDIEQMTFNAADHVVFTNDNQREFMLGYHYDHSTVAFSTVHDAMLSEEVSSNSGAKPYSRVLSKSLIWQQPCIPSEYFVVRTNYEMDYSKINIAYFGHFSAERKITTVFGFLHNPNVVVHIFSGFDSSTSYSEFTKQQIESEGDKYPGTLIVNYSVGVLEMMDIACKMDYLYLSGAYVKNSPHPYLPSKYADYRSVTKLNDKVKILMDAPNDSPLCKVNNPSIIRIPSEIIRADDSSNDIILEVRDFALSLEKQNIFGATLQQ